MTTDFYLREPLLPGMCGEDVKFLQEGLRIAGYDDVAVTGWYDETTELAWRDLASRNGLEGLHGDGVQHPNDIQKSVFGAIPGGTAETRERLDRYEEWIGGHPGAHGSLWPYRETDVAPPGSEGCNLISDAGTDPAITNLALYEEVRKQLPVEIGNDRAAEATLRAMQDGIKSPEQLEQVVIFNDKIFAVGNVPGVRGVVNLNQPAPSMAEMATQFAALDSASQIALSPPQETRAFARG